MTLVAALLGCTGLFANSSPKYYSNVTVQAETGKGLVYASLANEEPTDDKYQATFTLPITDESENKDVYLYAKPLESNGIFKYWVDANGQQINDIKVTVKGAKDNEKNPNQYSYTAVFGNKGLVQVDVNDGVLGTAVISKADNELGDRITITAALADPWAGGMGTKKWSKSHKFVGWYDSKGNLVSTDAKYTFDVTAPETYTAHFSWTPFVTGRGYYRVRYSYNQQFWQLTGSYDPTPGMLLTHDSRKINGVLDFTRQNDFSNPATIMKLDASSFNMIDKYKEETVVANGLTLEAQGTSTADVLNKYTLSLQTCHNVGFYKIISDKVQIAANEHNYGSEANPDLGYLYINTDQTGKSGSDPDSYFEFEPVDEAHVDQFYFGAQPDASMNFEGGYWTSMFTAFPYECYAPDGVEAYYISEITPANGVNIAVLSKMESGRVPANTAVLLKCKGLTPKENRLIPLWDDEAPLEKNLLNGEFQLNQTKDNPGHKTFDATKMRVFGSNEAGELGFYKLEDGKELAANKAWLDISGLSDAPVTKIVIRSDLTGIEGVEAEGTDPADMVIYDLNGRRVLDPVKGEIYIINHSKRVF